MAEANKKLAMTMLFGGIALLLITVGGAYLSQNPQIISKWEYQRDSARQAELQTQLLRAPASCKGQAVSLITAACDHLEDSADWFGQLAAAEKACLKDSFVITYEFKAEFDGDSVSNVKQSLNEEDVVLYACGVSESSDYYLTDKLSSSAEQFLNHWYQWKFDEGNYFE